MEGKIGIVNSENLHETFEGPLKESSMSFRALIITLIITMVLKCPI